MPKFGASKASAGKPNGAGISGMGLIIRAESVELFSMRGGQSVAHARVPLAGQGVSQLSNAIQELLNTAQVKPGRMAVAIPAHDVFIRFFTMPTLPRSEWESAVQFEARKYVPFKMDSLIWDSHIESRIGVGGSERLEVVFAGISREVFRDLNAALTAVSIQPTVIEPVSLSMARLASENDDFRCLVDVEEKRAHVVIAKAGVPYLTRDVSLVPESPAEASAAPAEPAAADVRLARLAGELSVSIDFFAREYSGATIREVLLFGDERVIAPWCQPLADQLRLTVEMGSTLLTGRVEGAVSLACGAVVGLVMRSGKSRGAAFNFIKQSSSGAGKSQRMPQLSQLSSISLSSLNLKGALSSGDIVQLLKSPQTIAMVVLSAVLLGAAWVWTGQGITVAQKHMNQVKSAQKTTGWGLDIMGEADLASLKGVVQAQLDLLKQIVDGRISVAAKMDALARELPEGVWLMDFDYLDELDITGASQPKLTLNGACFLGGDGKELSAIQDFEQNIKKNNTFLKGFNAVQLERIEERLENQEEKRYSYRTFYFNCQPGRRL